MAIDPGAWRDLKAALADTIPAARLIDDPLRTLAFGTDASFYRLFPSLSCALTTRKNCRPFWPSAERGGCQLLSVPPAHRFPGGGHRFGVDPARPGGLGHEILDEGRAIRLLPGVVDTRANALLAPFQRKIGPDPASINTCMIGGIAANNASGMCCGTAQNSYRTGRDIRVILADGALLDTANADSVAEFRRSHHELLVGLERLKADFEVVVPEMIGHLCCGRPFQSKARPRRPAIRRGSSTAS